MASGLYAEPRLVQSVSECYFYHTTDLPAIGVVHGQWDLRGRLRDYIGGVAVSGRRVLDVGTASGFLTFEMEKCGAEVVAMDADNADRIAMLPFHNRPYTTDRQDWKRRTDEFLERLKNSWWLTHRLLGSSSRAYYGDIYDLPAELGMFDVAVVGQVLVHLRDPITAIASIARRCSDTLVIIEGMFDSTEPVAKFFATAETGPEWVWWQYSPALYRELMKIVGFDVVSHHLRPLRLQP